MNKSEQFGFDCIVLWIMWWKLGGICGCGLMKLMYKEESSVAVYEKEWFGFSCTSHWFNVGLILCSKGISVFYSLFLNSIKWFFHNFWWVSFGLEIRDFSSCFIGLLKRECGELNIYIIEVLDLCVWWCSISLRPLVKPLRENPMSVQYPGLAWKTVEQLKFDMHCQNLM